MRWLLFTALLAVHVTGFADLRAVIVRPRASLSMAVPRITRAIDVKPAARSVEERVKRLLQKKAEDTEKASAASAERLRQSIASLNQDRISLLGALISDVSPPLGATAAHVPAVPEEAASLAPHAVQVGLPPPTPEAGIFATLTVICYGWIILGGALIWLNINPDAAVESLGRVSSIQSVIHPMQLSLSLLPSVEAGSNWLIEQSASLSAAIQEGITQAQTMWTGEMTMLALDGRQALSSLSALPGVAAAAVSEAKLVCSEGVAAAAAAWATVSDEAMLVLPTMEAAVFGAVSAASTSVVPALSHAQALAAATLSEAQVMCAAVVEAAEVAVEAASFESVAAIAAIKGAVADAGNGLFASTASQALVSISPAEVSMLPIPQALLRAQDASAVAMASVSEHVPETLRAVSPAQWMTYIVSYPAGYFLGSRV